MARAQSDKPGMAKVLDEVFAGENWREEITSTDFDTRADQAALLFKKMTGAKWATWVRMMGPNNATKYLLLHLTNHPKGRELMKDCIWKVCPEGGFLARQSDNPMQQYLITPTPDLQPLNDWLFKQLATGPTRYARLLELLRHELWREPELNSVFRQLRNQNRIQGDSYTGRFGPKSNPLLRIVD